MVPDAEGKLFPTSLPRPRPQSLLTLPPHVGVAFAGYSDWWIYIEGERTQQRWSGRLSIEKASEKLEKPIWIAQYLGRKSSRLSERPSVEAARGELLKALQDILPVAETIRAYEDWFRYALSQLDSGDPKPKFHADMLPPVGYSVGARQLAFAASSSWVFGGMGSWNECDAWPRAARDLRSRTTSRLYNAVMRALVDSVNSFDPKSR